MFRHPGGRHGPEVAVRVSALALRVGLEPSGVLGPATGSPHMFIDRIGLLEEGLRIRRIAR